MRGGTGWVRVAHRHAFVVAVVTGLSVAGSMVWSASDAAFSGYTTNPVNSWAVGQVTLTDDDTGANPDSGTAVFTAAGLIPGQSAAKCIRVTYTGNVAAKVRVHASAVSDGHSLGQYVELQIEEGTGTAEFDGDPACGTGDATFTADRTIYGSGLTGDVAAFGALSSYATGLPASAEWTPASTATRVYKITYRLDANTPSSHQGRSCTVAFRWQAQT